MARKGLPKWAIKEAKSRGAENIFAYAWTLVKRKGKKRSHPKTKETKRGGYKMAKKKKKRRSAGMTIPLAPIAGLAAGLATPVDRLLKGDLEAAKWWLIRNYTGYDITHKTWSFDNLKEGLFPLILGLIVHKFVGGSPLNLNKILARNKIPLIRI